MSKLVVFEENGKIVFSTTSDEKIKEELEKIGVRFEKWKVKNLTSNDEKEILNEYREDVERIMNEFGFRSVDVVSVTPDNPDKDKIRAKFLDEHIHMDFEVRFFVDGSGVFYIHKGKIYAILCEKGDFLSIPPNTTHWFDMGENPFLKCIRFFMIPDGWVAEFTGSDISKKFPKYEDIKAI